MSSKSPRGIPPPPICAEDDGGSNKNNELPPIVQSVSPTPATNGGTRPSSTKSAKGTKSGGSPDKKRSNSPNSKMSKSMSAADKLQEVTDQLNELRRTRQESVTGRSRGRVYGPRVDYTKKVIRKLNHPKLEYIYGEIVYSPYLVPYKQEYPKDIYDMSAHLKDLKREGYDFSTADPKTHPFPVKKTKNLFIKEVVNFEPCFGASNRESKIELFMQQSTTLDGQSTVNFEGVDEINGSSIQHTNKSLSLLCAGSRGGPAKFIKTLSKLKNNKKNASTQPMNVKSDPLLDTTSTATEEYSNGGFDEEENNSNIKDEEKEKEEDEKVEEEEEEEEEEKREKVEEEVENNIGVNDEDEKQEELHVTKEAETEETVVVPSPTGFVSGTLVVNHIKCHNMVNVERMMLDQNDPYVEVTFGSSTAKTAHRPNSGKTADFENLDYVFEVNRSMILDAMIHFRVMDHNKRNDHVEIGSCDISVADLLEQVGDAVEFTEDLFVDANEQKEKRGYIVVQVLLTESLLVSSDHGGAVIAPVPAMDPAPDPAPFADHDEEYVTAAAAAAITTAAIDETTVNEVENSQINESSVEHHKSTVDPMSDPMPEKDHDQHHVVHSTTSHANDKHNNNDNMNDESYSGPGGVAYSGESERLPAPLSAARRSSNSNSNSEANDGTSASTDVKKRNCVNNTDSVDANAAAAGSAAVEPVDTIETDAVVAQGGVDVQVPFSTKHEEDVVVANGNGDSDVPSVDADMNLFVSGDSSAKAEVCPTTPSVPAEASNENTTSLIPAASGASVPVITSAADCVDENESSTIAADSFHLSTNVDPPVATEPDPVTPQEVVQSIESKRGLSDDVENAVADVPAAGAPVDAAAVASDVPSDSSTAAAAAVVVVVVDVDPVIDPVVTGGIGGVPYMPSTDDMDDTHIDTREEASVGSAAGNSNIIDNDHTDHATEREEENAVAAAAEVAVAVSIPTNNAAEDEEKEEQKLDQSKKEELKMEQLKLADRQSQHMAEQEMARSVAPSSSIDASSSSQTGGVASAGTAAADPADGTGGDEEDLLCEVLS